MIRLQGMKGGAMSRHGRVDLADGALLMAIAALLAYSAVSDQSAPHLALVGAVAVAVVAFRWKAKTVTAQRIHIVDESGGSGRASAMPLSG